MKRAQRTWNKKWIYVLESDRVTNEITEDIMKCESFRRIRLVLSSKVTGRNKSVNINNWAMICYRSVKMR